MLGQQGVRWPRRDDSWTIHQDAATADELTTRAGQQRARLIKAHGQPLWVPAGSVAVIEWAGNFAQETIS
jgi:hypothetical protein